MMLGSRVAFTVPHPDATTVIGGVRCVPLLTIVGTVAERRLDFTVPAGGGLPQARLDADYCRVVGDDNVERWVRTERLWLTAAALVEELPL